MGFTIHAETVKDYAELAIVKLLIYKPTEQGFYDVYDFFEKIGCSVARISNVVIINETRDKELSEQKAVMIMQKDGKIEYTDHSVDFFKNAEKYLYLFR